MCVFSILLTFSKQNGYFMGITAHPKIFKTNQKIGKKICIMLKSTGICEVDLLSFDLPFARV